MKLTARSLMVGLVVVAAMAVLIYLVFVPPTGRPFIKDIEVKVVGGAIQAPAEVGVPARTSGVIKWKFGAGTTGYVFPDKQASAPGIVFKASSTLPSGCSSNPTANAPHNCDAKQHGSEFHCNVKPHAAGECYAYTITVVPSGGAPPVPPLDPWIKNE